MPRWAKGPEPGPHDSAKLPPDLAARVVEILVEECGYTRGDEFTERDVIWKLGAGTTEWCFKGALGWGGKLHTTATPMRRWGYLWVSAYPEDLTPERRTMCERATGRLRALMEAVYGP